MGCTQSKIENEEAVSRCKERKKLMKEAVSSRNAFAAAHSAYAMALKNTGAALSDYAQGEFFVSSHSSAIASSSAVAAPSSSSASAAVSSSVASPSAAVAAAAAAIPQPIPDTFTPPPPPPPPPPLQRAATMPEMKARSDGPPGGGLNGTIIEEDGSLHEEDDSELENRDRLVRKSRSRGGSNRGRKVEDNQEAPPPPPPSVASDVRTIPPPQQQQQHQQQPYFDYFFSAVENMPGTTLEETPVSAVPPAAPQPPFPDAQKEEPIVDRKSIDKRLRRSEDLSVAGNAKAEMEAEKAAIGIGSVRGMKKGKGTAIVGERRAVRGSVNLVNLFAEIDDNFLKASESAHDVSKMLEATRLHYHSNFADNRGHIDHSARVMRVITWNRSFRGVLNADNGKDDFDSEENETHATVLDKLLAWEKKLYDEVKAGELMKIDYQKKVAHLNRLKGKDGNSDSLERAKAAVSHLHTRYMVDMQSTDSTVSEINRLRDEQLCLKLSQLVDGLAKMWEKMQIHHQCQAEISKALKSLDISQAVKETSQHHHERTIQLLAVVQEWHTQFCRMIDHQKEYIKSLNSWLKLNLVHIESTLKEQVSSPPRVPSPPIQRLLLAWHDYLDKLSDEMVRTAINNFAAVISTIMQQQEEEMKLKYKCEETQRELERKTRQFKDWHNKYKQKRIPDEINPDASEDNAHKDAVVVREIMVEQVKKRLEEEVEQHQRQAQHVREKSLASLRTRLPELFQAMSEVAYACSDMYRALRHVSLRQNQSQRQVPGESSQKGKD